MMWWYGFGWPGMLVMSLGMVLWLVLLAVFVWALLRWLTEKTSTSSSPGTPSHGLEALEILRQRYARGEIDADTFEQMRRRLETTAI